MWPCVDHYRLFNKILGPYFIYINRYLLGISVIFAFIASRAALIVHLGQWVNFTPMAEYSYISAIFSITMHDLAVMVVKYGLR